MKRTPYRAGLIGDGLTDEQTTTYAMNSAIRTTEVMVRALAQRQGTVYRGGQPERQGDVYTRVWTGDNGHTVTAQAHPWRVTPATRMPSVWDDLDMRARYLTDQGWSAEDIAAVLGR